MTTPVEDSVLLRYLNLVIEANKLEIEEKALTLRAAVLWQGLSNRQRVVVKSVGILNTPEEAVQRLSDLVKEITNHD